MCRNGCIHKPDRRKSYTLVVLKNESTSSEKKPGQASWEEHSRLSALKTDRFQGGRFSFLPSKTVTDPAGFLEAWLASSLIRFKGYCQMASMI